MVDTLVTQVLPFAAIGLIGWVLARFEVFSRSDAEAINRFVFYIALPILMFRLISTTPLQGFDTRLAGAYLTGEILIILVTFLVCRYGFCCGLGESFLLGMASAFVNHVFFVLPVAVASMGNAAIAPIATIVVVDSVFLFTGTVLLLDRLTKSRTSPVGTVLRVFRNPQVIAVALGIAYSLSGLALPQGLDTFTLFVSAAAAPAALFTLGVILGGSLRATGIRLPVVVAVIKTMVHPLIAFACLAFVFPYRGLSFDMGLLVAAGPCGTLPFVLALHYKIPTQHIAKSILFSSVISLIGLSIFL